MAAVAGRIEDLDNADLEAAVDADLVTSPCSQLRDAPQDAKNKALFYAAKNENLDQLKAYVLINWTDGIKRKDFLSASTNRLHLWQTQEW